MITSKPRGGKVAGASFCCPRLATIAQAPRSQRSAYGAAHVAVSPLALISFSLIEYEITV
jgi:hypothetical protein